jgi:hypothetical protein
MTTITTHRVGAIVHITPLDSARYAGTYTVTKVNPTTYRLTNDTVANLKASYSMVHAGALDGDTFGTIKGAVEVPLPTEHFDSGTVVTLNGVRGVDPKSLWVVTGNVAKGYRVFPLGGSRRYYTGLPAARLTRVTAIDGWKA